MIDRNCDPVLDEDEDKCVMWYGDCRGEDGEVVASASAGAGGAGERESEPSDKV